MPCSRQGSYQELAGPYGRTPMISQYNFLFIILMGMLITFGIDYWQKKGDLNTPND